MAAKEGRCCDCNYEGAEETPCSGRADKTHCVHWWDVDEDHDSPESRWARGELSDIGYWILKGHD